MKAEILIFFSFDMLSGIGLGQAEFTPVETSVTRFPHGLYRNGLIRRGLRCGCARDRVWPLKQEALTLQGRVVHMNTLLFIFGDAYEKMFASEPSQAYEG